MAVEWTDGGVPYLSDESLIGDVPEYTQLLRLGGATPVGSVQAFAGANSPEGWLLCDGAAFNESLYPVLRSVLGKGTTPDMRGRTIHGYNSGDGSFNTMLNTGGRQDTVLPSHDHPSHSIGNHQHDVKNEENNFVQGSQFSGGGPYNLVYLPCSHWGVHVGGWFRAVASGATSVTIAARGEGTSVTSTSNLSPYLVMQWIIKHDYPRG